MSETAASRHLLAGYCSGLGLDIGFGGDAVVPSAITMDMPKAYTSVGQDVQILRGDCGDLSGFCDGVLDYVYSAHLLEDFPYSQVVAILTEWRRVLKTGGLIVTNCPDQQRFLEAVRNGQGNNLSHFEQDFSLATFRQCLALAGEWEEVFVEPVFGAYSFLLVVRKVKA